MKRLTTALLLVLMSLVLTVGTAAAQEPDPFAPDVPPLTFTDGGLVAVGDTIDGFVNQDERVEYSLVLTEETGLSISMIATDPAVFFDSYLRVYDSDGVLIGENDDNIGCECLDSLLRVVLPAGVYTIEAATFVDFDTGPYQLSLTMIDITDEGIIGVGSIFENELAENATDQYTLIISEPQAVRVLFDPTEGSTLAADMTLTSADGFVLEFAVPREPDSRALSLTTFVLNVGEYTLQVAGIEGSGGYAIVVGPPATDRGFLPIGEQVTNFLQSGERARYQMVLSAPQTLNISVQTTQPTDFTNDIFLDPDLILIDEAGFEIEFGTLFETPSGQLGAEIQRRFEPGTYTLEVRDFVDAGAGEYVLLAQPLSVDERGPIGIPESVGGTVDANTLDTYQLSVPAQDVVRITVSLPEGSTLEPKLIVYDSFGFPIYNSTFDFVTPEGISVTLDVFPEDYLIEVSSATGDGGGDYVLTIDSAQVEKGPITVGQSIEGELIAGLRDVYTLTLTEPAALTIQVLSQEGQFGIAGFDPVLAIYDEAGNFLFFNDDYFTEEISTSDARIDESFEPGTYIIEVGSFFDEETGLYAVSVSPQQ